MNFLISKVLEIINYTNICELGCPLGNSFYFYYNPVNNWQLYEKQLVILELNTSIGKDFKVSLKCRILQTSSVFRVDVFECDQIACLYFILFKGNLVLFFYFVGEL